MKTEAGVSSTVTAGMVLISVVLFTLVYGALMVADIYLLNKYARGGPVAEESLVPANGIGEGGTQWISIQFGLS